MDQKQNIFDELKGEQLSAVTFVQDYLQLDFDGNRLTLYIWPTIHTNGDTWKFDNANYRNELCGMIAKLVKSTTLVENRYLSLRFDDGSQIEVPLNEDNPELKGPEILYYTNTKDEWVAI